MFTNRFRRLGLEKLEAKLTLDGAAFAAVDAVEEPLPTPTDRPSEELIADPQETTVLEHELGHTLGFRHEHVAPSSTTEQVTLAPEQDTASIGGMWKVPDVTLKRGLIGDDGLGGLDGAADDMLGDSTAPAAGSTFFDGRFLTADDMTRDQASASDAPSISSLEVPWAAQVDSVFATEESLDT